MIYTSDLELDEFNEAMKKAFEMIDPGLMKYFLGIEVKQSKKINFICQNKYAKDMLKKFMMEKIINLPLHQLKHVKS